MCSSIEVLGMALGLLGFRAVDVYGFGNKGLEGSAYLVRRIEVGLQVQYPLSRGIEPHLYPFTKFPDPAPSALKA